MVSLALESKSQPFRDSLPWYTLVSKFFVHKRPTKLFCPTLNFSKIYAHQFSDYIHYSLPAKGRISAQRLTMFRHVAQKSGRCLGGNSFTTPRKGLRSQRLSTVVGIQPHPIAPRRSLFPRGSTADRRSLKNSWETHSPLYSTLSSSKTEETNGNSHSHQRTEGATGEESIHIPVKALRWLIVLYFACSCADTLVKYRFGHTLAEERAYTREREQKRILDAQAVGPDTISQ